VKFGRIGLQLNLHRLDLPTPEGWKAEFTYVTGYIPRRFTNPEAHGSESHSQVHTRPHKPTL